MKLVSALLSLLLSSVTGLQATTYYVSPIGSDSYTGLAATRVGSTTTGPFLHIQKAADMMNPGDTCNILSGTYRETVTVSDSNVTFQRYGTGTVTIDGTEVFATSGWTRIGTTRVFYAPMGWTLGDGNQIFQSSALKPEARWPDPIPAATDGTDYPWQNSALAHPTNGEIGDWSYVDAAGYDANNQNGWVTDAQLASHPDGYWTGATLHIISGAGWIMQHAAVTGYTNATKKLTTNDPNGANSAFVFRAGNEFYLTGIKDEMTVTGEWFYEASTGRLYFYSPNTSEPVGVQAKKRSYGFDLRGRSNVSILNLAFFACTIQTDGGSTSATFDGLTMQYLGHSQKDSVVFGLVLANGSTLKNSDLGWDSRGLVYLAGNDIRVINNCLHDSGYVPFWDSTIGGYGYRHLVSHNTMSSAGRAIMGSPGREAIVQYNDMFNAMRLTVDGGVLYTCLDAGNTIFRYNLLHDSPGPAGRSGAGVQGFYLDCLNSNWVVHHNIIWGLPGYAMQFNARQNFNMVFNNTCWNAAAGSLITASTQDGESGSRFYNNLFNSEPKGVLATWSRTDFRYNLHSDPGFVNPSAGNFQLLSGSPGINQGTPVPGVTDGSVGVPDIGALENGAADWTANAGCLPAPPPADLIYSAPDMVFANKLKDGSFESGWLNPAVWTTAAGSNMAVGSSPSWVTGFQGQSRSGYGNVTVGTGTSEIRQTVNGLLGSRKYKFYAGIRTADPAARVYIGVRNYGSAALCEIEALGGTGGAWEMLALPFYTGSASTSAEAYVRIVSTTSLPVYLDDLSVELAQENTDPQPYGMPVVNYPFDESAGGVTAYNATTSTAALNATLTSASFAPGRWGNALTFAGTGGYASASSVPSAPTSFTVAFWVKFDDAGTGTPLVASNTNGSNTVKGWFIQANQNRTVAMGINDGTSSVQLWTGGMTAGANVWTHIAFTVDRVRGVIKGFHDGTLAGAITIPSGFGDVSTSLGLRLGSATLKGQMDDFQMWDSALPDEAIRPMASADPLLALRLKFDENPGASMAWDANGTGKNGVLTGMNPGTCWAGGALQFSSQGYVQCPPLAMTSNASFTVAFWVKFADVGSGTPLLASNTSGKNTVKGWFVQANQNRTVAMGIHDGTSSIQLWNGGLTASANVWSHFTFTVDRANGLLTGYRNGASIGSCTIPTGFGGMETGLGPDFGRTQNSSTFNGQMDDVRIYSRAVEPWEIQELPKPLSAAPYF